jgi:hypothetical protein
MILQARQFGGLVRSQYFGFGTEKTNICSRLSQTYIFRRHFRCTRQVNLGFKLLPPKLKIGPGRKRKNRFKASHEPGARKLEKFQTCGEVGQHDPNCSVPKKK